MAQYESCVPWVIFVQLIGTIITWGFELVQIALCTLSFIYTFAFTHFSFSPSAKITLRRRNADFCICFFHSHQCHFDILKPHMLWIILSHYLYWHIMLLHCSIFCADILRYVVSFCYTITHRGQRGKVVYRRKTWLGGGTRQQTGQLHHCIPLKLLFKVKTRYTHLCASAGCCPRQMLYMLPCRSGAPADIERERRSHGNMMNYCTIIP